MNMAICEDNQIDLDTEYQEISNVMLQKNIVYSMQKFVSPETLVNSEENYDMVFLDIEMPNLSGLEVAREIRAKNKKCIFFFITNHENYLDAALDEYAFRFWIKPLNKQRLKQGIESAIKRIESYNKIIEINVDRIKTKIDINKILFICADNKKTRVVTTEKEYIVSEPFKIIKDKINSYAFYEPHASYYVNLNYVRTYNHTMVVCTAGQRKYEIYMSRRKYAAFNQYFINWIGEQI